MITKEFRRWAEDIKDSIKQQVGELAWAWMTETQLDVISVGIDFSEGQRFWMSFSQQEFDRNNEKCRRRIIEIRREDFIRNIKDFVKKVTETIEKLKYMKGKPYGKTN